MTVPKQINAKSLDDYLEVMTRAVFQTGVSWALIESKWPAFRKAFADFDTHKVAKFSKAKIDRLAADESILRSRNKIAATVHNAQMLIAIEEEFGDITKYFKSMPDYDSLKDDLKNRFKYLGEMNCYYFLFRVKQPVPDFTKWISTIAGDHPRMKEMVKGGKKRSAK